MSARDVGISDLIAEGTTQARHYDEKRVKRYAQALNEGAVFPPVVAFSNGNGLYLADGFHRRGAALKVGQKTIRVDVRGPVNDETPQRSAILYAVGANDDHGENRSPEDKRHAVEMLLRDPEWSKWTDPEIARQCRVSREFVQKHRTKMINAGVLAEHPKKRKAKRGGKEYEIDTGKIGSKSGNQQKKPTPQKKTTEIGWTKDDDKAVDAIMRALETLGKAWQSATRPAQIHMAETVKRTLRTMT